jgi:hypothetical protein
MLALFKSRNVSLRGLEPCSEGADWIVGVDVRAVRSPAPDEKVRHGRGWLAAGSMSSVQVAVASARGPARYRTQPRSAAAAGNRRADTSTGAFAS